MNLLATDFEKDGTDIKWITTTTNDVKDENSCFVGYSKLVVDSFIRTLVFGRA